jgi:hypothetical protein
MGRPSAALTARFVPSCEALETRLVPAVNLAEINGHILLIDGAADAEQVAITDDGYGNVTVSAGVGGATLGTFDGIDRITVRLREGADNFEYVRGGGLTPTVEPAIPHTPMKLKIDLGTGADHAGFDLSQGLTDEKVVIHFNGFADNDDVHLDAGTLTDARLLLFGDLGLGDDSFHANLDGDLLGKSILGLDIAGGLGNDLIEAQATDVDTGADAVLGLYLQGNVGDDQVAVNYTGQNLGGIGVLVTGGFGKDTVNVAFSFDTGSTGDAAVGVYAGEGNDTITMTTAGAGSLGEKVFLVHGAAGTDTGITTSDVIKLSIENTTLPVPMPVI